MQEDYKQAQFTMTDATAQILSGKHSQTVKYKKCKEVRVQRDLSHNRTKRYILPEGTPVGFLIDLGVMTKEGKLYGRSMINTVRLTAFWNLSKTFCRS